MDVGNHISWGEVLQQKKGCGTQGGQGLDWQ